MLKEISCSESFKFFFFIVSVPGNLCHNHISKLNFFHFEPNYFTEEID